MSKLKFLGFFGHDTNIQNFYKLFIGNENLYTNKHRIPEFAATLSWELFQVQVNDDENKYELQIKVDGDYLDTEGCPNGICDV